MKAGLMPDYQMIRFEGLAVSRGDEHTGGRRKRILDNINEFHVNI